MIERKIFMVFWVGYFAKEYHEMKDLFLLDDNRNGQMVANGRKYGIL